LSIEFPVTLNATDAIQDTIRNTPNRQEITMPNEPQSPEQFKKMVEDTVNSAVKAAAERTHSALDDYLDFIKKAMSSFPIGNNELVDAIKANVEKNIAATKDYLEKLSNAKDMQDVAHIHSEYLKTQANAFRAQTKEFGEAITKSARNAFNFPHPTD
jgi:hypothetical protein